MCLGSNMGDTDLHLANAIAEIDSLDGVRVTKSSSIFRTEPQLKKDQAWFANQVVSVECSEYVTAHDLLNSLLEIENTLGRVREERFGPRVIDLDVLLFGNEVIESEDLIVPHPRMTERAFVLVPLQEIAPQLHFPDGRGLEEVLGMLEYKVDANQIWQ
ncbi:2-amino-4-hydroxy-6-hydroxymethyldihydropteridine diphosphokinase [Halodesulfovibrio sp.]|uniref:2-amino-4-hydroxy-6- hydroxymethyldihydropteridine diphosphokinase n=1 Tax=Halodesulfovibrio sp. TaxID=1912772 RepID=UPI0025D01623|nr:2-amino-4-hydroxy-6-hydroxymethyldihydropteridine diphosphokinase [Halodesulfovibrio sp.]MCT4627819.1 2-amino-4-hydroxy-6-hydroxymethyldihydropteridine diphosphokinase [Halodesulfovibrio sp.]